VTGRQMEDWRPVPTFLLVLGALSLLHAVNALFPRKGRLLLAWSFFASWLTIELAPWWLAWELVLGVVAVAGGGLDEATGWLGLGLLAAGAGLLVGIVAKARKTNLHLEDADKEIELDPDHSPSPFPRAHLFLPFLLMRRRAGVEVTRNVVFGEGVTKKGKTVRLRLDVVRPKGVRPGEKRPGVLQIHGGGWVIGDKREQGWPLLNHLAANGWVGINANYRLSPKVGFPEHLVDCKKAIAWWREHAEELGGDPDFLCVTGGSAGGHLAALVGLTAGDTAFQPGFEGVDTGVRAAVPFYGVYDLTNRGGHWHKDTVRLIVEPLVMQRKLADDPEAFAAYSPMDRVRPDAPPFFVIHGSLDTLVPVQDAREFVRRLQGASDAPVLYAEMQGAQHAFEIFPSYRAARVIESVERFLHAVHRAYQRGGEPTEGEAARELVDNENTF
jgi:acetyl esterase/lipase